MRILSFTDQLGIGGSQVNAIELAAALQNIHGFEVSLFGNPGPMVNLIRAKGLRYIPSPHPGFLPSPGRIRALRESIRNERPALVHVWDWWQCLDAFYGVHVPMRIPMIATVMEMTIPRLLPKRLPTTFGTPDLVAEAKLQGRNPVALLVPPVDVETNAPDVSDPGSFFDQWSLDESEIKLITISRLATHLKGESLHRTIDAVGRLAHTLPIKFIIVGDGPERAALERRAADINKKVGRDCVLVIGPMLDPRSAYAAADIFIGMGGSALRAMAFHKPVIVVGENGYSSCFLPETAESIYQKGLYGSGDGDPENQALVSNICKLASMSRDWPRLGQFSRQFVVSRFSIEAVSERFAQLCRATAAEPISMCAAGFDVLRTAALYIKERRFTWDWGPEPIPTKEY